MINLTHVLADLRIYLKGYFRNKNALFGTLILPVVIMLLFGTISIGTMGKVPVYIQNLDSGPASGAFINTLNETKLVDIRFVGDSQNFTQTLRDYSTPDGIVIPVDFTACYTSGKCVNVTLFGNPSSSTSQIVAGVTQSIANAFNLRRAGGANVVVISQTTIRTTTFKYIDFLVPGLIGYSILTGPMMSLINVSSDYKKEKMFKLLSLTPLTKSEWLISRSLCSIILSAVSFVFMTYIGVAAFGATIDLSLWLIPFLILGPLFFTSLGMLVGTFAKSPESAGAIGNLVLFPMMFLSGTFFPISSMPANLQSIAHALPLYYIIEGLSNVMIYHNYGGALIDLAITTAITALVFLLAVHFFKWRED